MFVIVVCIIRNPQFFLIPYRRPHHVAVNYCIIIQTFETHEQVAEQGPIFSTIQKM